MDFDSASSDLSIISEVSERAEVSQNSSPMDLFVFTKHPYKGKESLVMINEEENETEIVSPFTPCEVNTSRKESPKKWSSIKQPLLLGGNKKRASFVKETRVTKVVQNNSCSCTCSII
ncbi:unnamed protein product [Blepharisma stoltei]|uniref:Uncharacterized protein n=1 Tax=Blepharisma stoltei TaxID=1481888 RepID=A0AAU9IEN9_9CILI|nr:unnamed protein product [Blepharisma stoltei]